MEQKYFLKLNGVTGQSENPRHRGEIEILGISWGSNNLPANGAVNRAHASVNDVNVVKRTDQSTHFLFLAGNSGQNFADGMITVEEIGDKQSLVRTTQIALYSVQVSTFLSDGKTDSFSLNFDWMKMVR
jgi:type VI secretion system secreted protein Hcp